MILLDGSCASANVPGKQLTCESVWRWLIRGNYTNTIIAVRLVKSELYHGIQSVWTLTRRTPGIFCTPTTSRFHDQLHRERNITWLSASQLVFLDTVQAIPPCSLTFLPVVAFDIDAEDRDLLPLGLVVTEVYVGDGDAPGRQVPLGACCAGRLNGGIVLHHNCRLLHLQEQTQPGDWSVISKKNFWWVFSCLFLQQKSKIGDNLNSASWIITCIILICGT